jgi:endo-1,4-beta-xylanase
MKHLNLVLLFAFLLTSCAPTVTATATPTQMTIPTTTNTPLSPTITPTPTPENLVDAKDLPTWIDQYVHAYGGHVTINGMDMDASQLTDEIRKNAEAFTQMKEINGKELPFFVINNIPLAMRNSDNLWTEFGYKEISPDNFEVGASFSVWTGDYGDDPRYKEVFAENFNLVATDGSLSEYDLLKKIPNDAEVTPQQAIDLYDWTDFNKIAEYAQQNKLPLRAMHLFLSPVIDMNTPKWLEQMSDDQLREYIKLHIASILSRANFREVSIANEAFYGAGIPGNSFFYARLGESYIELAFQTAHELSPDTILILNDNIVYGPHGLGSDDGVWTNSITNGESNAIFNFAKKEIEKGIPINGIGIESHLAAIDFVVEDIDANIEKYKADLTTLIERYGKLGVDVYITELDVNIAGLPSEWNNQQKQHLKAQIYRAIFEACLYSENCKSVTTWGFSDTATWMLTAGYPYGAGESPLPLDMNYRPTISYYAIKQTLFEYWK